MDLSPAEVLYILQKPSRTRFLDPTYQGGKNSDRLYGWAYHAALQYEGKIIDLDLPPNLLYVSPARYFATMFTQELNDWSKMNVRRIRGETYRNEFSPRKPNSGVPRNKGPFYWREFDHGDYPLMPLSRFLEEAVPQAGIIRTSAASQ